MEERDEVSHPLLSVVDSQSLMLRFVKLSNILFLLNSLSFLCSINSCIRVIWLKSHVKKDVIFYHSTNRYLTKLLFYKVT